MRDYLLLVGVQVRGLFGISRFLNQKGKGGGMAVRLVGLALVALAAGAFFLGAATVYNFLFLNDLHAFAREELLYSAAFGFLFLALLLTYLFMTAGALYGGKDYELLSSFPVSQKTVVLSKLTGYYLIGLAVTLLYFLPAIVLVGIYADVSPLFYPAAVCNLFAFPVLPLSVALACVSCAAFVAARPARRNAVQSLLLGVFLVVLAVLSFAGWESPTGRSGVGALFAGMPFGAFFGRSAVEPNVWIWLCYLAVTAGAFLGSFYLSAALYPRINDGMRANPSRRRAEKRDDARCGTPYSALFRRELKLVFSNLTLLLNVISAGIFAVVLSVAFLFVRDMFLSDAVFRGYFVLFLPVGLGGFGALSLYAATAINVEGQELWLLKSLPVSSERILSAKYRVSLLLSLPPALLSLAVCGAALKLSFSEAVFFFAAGILPLCAGNYAGLIINLLKPRFDWKNRAQAAKQSSSVLFAMLFNLLTALLLAGGAYLFGIDGTIVGLAAVSLAGGALCAAGYLLLYGVGAKRFERL